MICTGDSGEARMDVEMAGGASAGADTCSLNQLAIVGETVRDQRTRTALVGLLCGVEHGQGRVPPEPRGRKLGLDG